MQSFKTKLGDLGLIKTEKSKNLLVNSFNCILLLSLCIERIFMFYSIKKKQLVVPSILLT